MVLEIVDGPPDVGCCGVDAEVDVSVWPVACDF